MSEFMKGGSLILSGLGTPVQTLPQQQAPLFSSASTTYSTSCSTILSSHFQPCRWLRYHFSHTIRPLRRALWMDCRSIPAGLNLIAQGRLQSRASYGSRDWSRDTAQGNGSTHMHSAGTTSQAIPILNNRLQRGINVDSYMYVHVLRRCLKQKDLLTAKQVHDWIIQTGMEKNPSLARCLLNVYIQCGKLLDARRLFDELEKKTIVTWTLMIAGYAKYDNAESAFEIFNQMRQEGCRPNEVTYLEHP